MDLRGSMGCVIGVSQISDSDRLEIIMSFGVVGQPKTKRALKEMIAEHGADKVMVFDTSAFGNQGTIPITQLKPSDVIVGPDVEKDRRWYANYRNGKIV